jgi:hypothetical protein
VLTLAIQPQPPGERNMLLQTEGRAGANRGWPGVETD